jgi:hypothetical protein
MDLYVGGEDGKVAYLVKNSVDGTYAIENGDVFGHAIKKFDTSPSAAGLLSGRTSKFEFGFGGASFGDVAIGSAVLVPLGVSGLMSMSIGALMALPTASAGKVSFFEKIEGGGGVLKNQTAVVQVLLLRFHVWRWCRTNLKTAVNVATPGQRLPRHLQRPLLRRL